MSVSKKWLEILKKNDIEFQKNSNKENIIPYEEEISDNKNSVFIRCPDEEFNHIYMDKMIDIKFDFKEFIEHKGFPFLDKNPVFNKKLNFYDFLKNHSSNYKDVCRKIEQENKETEEEEDNDDEVFNENFYYHEKD